MVKVIMGQKGSGKTKQLIDYVNQAISSEDGNVVCVERGTKLTYDINHRARLIDISDFPVSNYDMLKGFICGMYAGNYDITKVFLDSLYKIANSDDICAATEFIVWLNDIATTNNIKFYVTISDDVTKANDTLKKFF